jgi:ATP-dependent DNA helicase RecG
MLFVIAIICQVRQRVFVFFDDRLEVWNPGVLPPDLSPAILLRDHPSHPPNKLIAECFFDTKIIERWGTGTVRMAEALEAQKQPPPAFDVSAPNVFKVIMFATGYSDAELHELGLNERQMQAVRYLQVSKTLTNAQYQELFGLSKATASRDLSDLVTKKVIAKVGTTGKGTSYVLLEPKRLT